MSANFSDTKMQYSRAQSQRQSRVHQQFLQNRQTTLREINKLLQWQTTLVAPAPGQQWREESPVFSRMDLEEFATGSLERCFGPEYRVFRGKRVPRIPNGDLMLFDRVLKIKGIRNELNAPASIISAYDVPHDAWYLQQNAYPTVPISILMEMALQPCGFLSAYLGTALSAPEQDFLFRNLDGSAALLTDLDLRGQVVINHASLQSTVSGAGTIIQTFTFSLSCNGVDFFGGESVFGYFPPEMMAQQTGLDNQRQPAPVQGLTNLPQESWDAQDRNKPYYRLSSGQMDFLDHIHVSRDGGDFGLGMAYSRKVVDPQDWFFACHFYQDPVMPGSLGVEAIQQSLQAFCLAYDLGCEFRSPRFSLLTDTNMQWKYRGQITPDIKQFEIELHIRNISQTSQGTEISADGMLWKDSKPIYRVENITLETY